MKIIDGKEYYEHDEILSLFDISGSSLWRNKNKFLKIKIKTNVYYEKNSFDNFIKIYSPNIDFSKYYTIKECTEILGYRPCSKIISYLKHKKTWYYDKNMIHDLKNNVIRLDEWYEEKTARKILKERIQNFQPFDFYGKLLYKKSDCHKNEHTIGVDLNLYYSLEEAKSNLTKRELKRKIKSKFIKVFMINKHKFFLKTEIESFTINKTLYYTSLEVAELLKVNIATIHIWAIREKLKHLKIENGHVFLFEKNYINNLIDNLKIVKGYTYFLTHRSYPEELLDKKLRENNITNFIPQYRIKRYSLDFAWDDIKLDVEVDGKFHFTENGIAHDKKRDLYTKTLGWTVMRFEVAYLLKNVKQIVEIIKNKIQELTQRKNLQEFPNFHRAIPHSTYPS